MDNSKLVGLNTDTKVKYINNNFNGSLDLENSWGSLVKILKQVLCEGFNETTLQSIERDSVNNILTIKFTTLHSYDLNSVLKVEGVSVMIDGEYRVLDFGPDFVKVASDPSKVYVEPFVITGDSKAITAPLGYEILYDEILTTGRLVIKNKSGVSPAILKIIDKEPGRGYLPTWAKFARVVFGQNIESIDEFVNNEKAPLQTKYPYSELTGDGKEGSAGVHGFAKWHYAVSKSHAPSETGIPSDSDFPVPWRIIGDDKTFYLFIKNQDSYSWYSIMSFGNYASNLKEDSQNIILHAAFHTHAANTSNGSYTYSSMYNYFTENNTFKGCCLFKNTSRGLENEFFGYHFGLDPGDSPSTYRNYPSGSKEMAPVSGNTGNKLTSPIFIKDKYFEFRGQLRGISQLYGQDYKGLEGYLLEGSKIVLAAQRAYNSSNTEPNVPYLFSLKDWD